MQNEGASTYVRHPAVLRPDQQSLGPRGGPMRGATRPSPPPSNRPPSRWDIPRDQGLDALDLVIGRAAGDPGFRRRLLAEPAAALALADIPLPLKHRLIAIRARDLGDFALQALEAEAALTRSVPAVLARGPAGDGVA